MADWRFISKTRTGTALASLTDLMEVRGELFLNQPGSLSGTLPLSSAQANSDWLTPGVHELVALRDGDAQETVFPLVGRNVVTDEQGDGKVELGWVGALAYLSGLFIPSGYSDTDTQDRVAWNAINTAQSKTNADYGIADGSHTASQPSTTLDTADAERDLKGALEDLSNRANGFDYRVDSSGLFHTHYPFRGTDRSSTVLFRHGANCMVESLTDDASPGAIVNAVTVKGGDGITVTAEDTASQLVYGRREAVVTYSEELGSAATLQAYADAIVEQRATPTLAPLLRVDTRHPDFIWGEAWLGDTVAVRADLGSIAALSGSYRVVALRFSLSAQHDESLWLELQPVGD